MSKIKITFEVEISGDDAEHREKASSVLIASMSDVVRRTIKKMNFWSSQYDGVRYELNINTERLDK